MYTMSASAQANFLSTDFMGVSSNATVTNAAVDGAINIVKIKSGGTGGTNGTHTGIPIRGDGSNGQVSVTITACCYRCFSYNTWYWLLFWLY